MSASPMIISLWPKEDSILSNVLLINTCLMPKLTKWHLGFLLGIQFARLVVVVMWERMIVKVLEDNLLQSTYFHVPFDSFLIIMPQ